ncbi:hypothetical protein B0H12DRAFT_749579 [Mycena haematopus]|nr:hypothetical protein B0H12DRAFT_749579 [Mycena haematopus]
MCRCGLHRRGYTAAQIGTAIAPAPRRCDQLSFVVVSLPTSSPHLLLIPPTPQRRAPGRRLSLTRLADPSSPRRPSSFAESDVQPKTSHRIISHRVPPFSTPLIAHTPSHHIPSTPTPLLGKFVGLPLRRPFKSHRFHTTPAKRTPHSCISPRTPPRWKRGESHAPNARKAHAPLLVVLMLVLLWIDAHNGCSTSSCWNEGNQHVLGNDSDSAEVESTRTRSHPGRGGSGCGATGVATVGRRRATRSRSTARKTSGLHGDGASSDSLVPPIAARAMPTPLLPGGKRNRER